MYLFFKKSREKHTIKRNSKIKKKNEVKKKENAN